MRALGDALGAAAAPPLAPGVVQVSIVSVSIMTMAGVLLGSAANAAAAAAASASAASSGTSGATSPISIAAIAIAAVLLVGALAFLALRARRASFLSRKKTVSHSRAAHGSGPT
jgi:hypothetical protein